MKVLVYQSTTGNYFCHETVTVILESYFYGRSAMRRFVTLPFASQHWVQKKPFLTVMTDRYTEHTGTLWIILLFHVFPHRKKWQCHKKLSWPYMKVELWCVGGMSSSALQTWLLITQYLGYPSSVYPVGQADEKMQTKNTWFDSNDWKDIVQLTAGGWQ